MNIKARKKGLESGAYAPILDKKMTWVTMKLYLCVPVLALLVFGGLTVSHTASAQDAKSLLSLDKKEPLPVPRFASLGSGEVNLRAGPGLRYPVRWVISKEGLPVEIIREFDTWREVRDHEGDEGWVHQSMLSGRRTVIITEGTLTLMREPDESSLPVAKIEPQVLMRISKCDRMWCMLEVAGYKGYARQDRLWGVYPQEKID